MKAIIHTISPQGFAVDFETPESKLEELMTIMPKLEHQLAGHGYQGNAQREWPRTPDGSPICPIHGVPMRLRQKQGDEWWSHKIGDTDEYCRGFIAPAGK